jgi:NAD(P)-dependent dehydrogenase (short-subunit alcohol dehydrogenase family)
MDTFVTGGTGFVGRNLIERLLEREGTVHVLVRPGSMARFEQLEQRFAPRHGGRLQAVAGDLTLPGLGLSEADLARLQGRIGHFFHVAALYDLKADAASQRAANVDGTRHAVHCATALGARCFHHVSSIAVSGLYQGTFREDMFDEAERLVHPYFVTKHEAEAIVRKECGMPWRVYRPGSVVGHSRTGEIDKIDGPYYSFKLLQKMRNLMPRWMPLAGLDAGRFNIVPVDYVAAALDHIAHQEGLDGECFHLTNPDHYTSGEMLNIFADAGHAPRFGVRLDLKVFSFLPSGLASMLGKLPPVRRLIAAVLDGIGIPADATLFAAWDTRYDRRQTERALKGSGIEVPRLPDYAARLWDYWERNLDPDLFIDRTLEGNVRGKVLVISGGGSGIGLGIARRMAAAGAHVVIAGRTPDKLEAARQSIAQAGGICHAHAVDLTDLDACDRFIAQVLAEHGRIDILVNNAGRSIRRAVADSYERFHDFERTMQINYFSALRCTLRVLPGMSERRSGHVINISSMGVLGPPARFSAYVASKSALEGFTRCAETEFADSNVHFTNINMPLVRTDMIAPTKAYDYAPALSVDEAVELVVEAVIHKASRVATANGRFQQVLNVLAPKIHATLMNVVFRMFDDSRAGAPGRRVQDTALPTAEQVALAQLVKGVHY